VTLLEQITKEIPRFSNIILKALIKRKLYVMGYLINIKDDQLLSFFSMIANKFSEVLNNKADYKETFIQDLFDFIDAAVQKYTESIKIELLIVI
jgi:hypothetical protein